MSERASERACVRVCVRACVRTCARVRVHPCIQHPLPCLQGRGESLRRAGRRQLHSGAPEDRAGGGRLPRRSTRPHNPTSTRH